MAKPESYRKVGHISRNCEKCRNFTKLTGWCKKWNFVANELYTCSKWIQGSGEVEEESDLKKQYRVAAGDKFINREENYAREYTPSPKSEDIENGYIERYFVKQSNNPYAQIIEVSERAYRSYGSPDTGIDGTHYNIVSVQWTIKGPVEEVIQKNTRIADYIESRYPEMIGLKDYLYSNLSRFWEGGK